MDYPKNIVNVSGACFDYIPVYSPGIWNIKKGETILQHPFFRFQLQLLSLVTISHLFHIFLKRYHFPRLTSDVLAGLFIGPTFFERLWPREANLIFPPTVNFVFGSLLKLGYILYVFLSAVKLDTSWVKRMGKKGFLLGALLFAFPYTMMLSVQLVFDTTIPITPAMKDVRYLFSTLYIEAFARSQFVDVSVVLMQLKITNSRLGHLALVSTLIGDLGRYLYSHYDFMMTRVIYTTSARHGFQSLVIYAIYMSFIFGIMRTLSFWFIRITPEGKKMKGFYVHVVVVAVLFSSSTGDTVGLDYLCAPFLIGLLIPAGSPLAMNLTSELDTVVYGLLLPLLNSYCASKVNLWEIFNHFEDTLNFQMAFISYFIKVIATFFMVLCVNVSSKDAFALSLILNMKGTYEMGRFLSFTPLETKDLDSTSGVFLIFLLTSYAPPLIRMLYDPSKHYIGYTKKCIQHTPNEAQLEILVCAHKQEDAIGAIRLLEISTPSKQNPTKIYVLCLQDMIGNDTPIMINHQLGQSTSPASKSSCSQPIIYIFNYFKLQYKKSAQINIFTAISPLKQMYLDICWVGFDKSCSFILLPFHKKWNNNGKLVSNNNDLRNLNISVLERAPCSVGILIDLRKSKGLSSIFDASKIYKVIVFFIGGGDDREALAYGYRMAKSQKVQLTIVNLSLAQDISSAQDSWEDMLDNECMRKIRAEMNENSNIIIVNETVRDGSDTITIVHSYQGNCDLVLVGRRHETNQEALSGLAQWSEIEELGPIGDVLASADDSNVVSVLVIQEQVFRVDQSNILN